MLARDALRFAAWLAAGLVVPSLVVATDRPAVARGAARAVTAADVDPASPEGRWYSVAVSPAHGGTFVVYGEREIRLTRDDGRTFSPVLRGRLRRVGSVALDARGQVVAVGEGPDGRPALASSSRSIRAPEGMTPSFVQSAGPYLALVGHRPAAHGQDEDDVRTIALSDDAGATWRRVPMMRWGNFANLVHLEADGTVHHLSSTEAACGGGMQQHHRLAPNATEWTDEQWPFDAPVSMQVGPRGWQYALDDRCGRAQDDTRERLCAARGGRLLGLGEPLGEHAYRSFSLASNARVALATLEGRLLRLSADRAHELARGVPDGFALVAVDAHGRPLGMLRGRVVRWSARGGWRVLAQ